MARFRRTATATRTVVVRAPAQRSPTIRVVAPATVARVKRGARAVGRRVYSAAADESHTMWALGAAGAAAYVKKNKIDVPNPTPFSDEAFYGGLAWAWGKWGKNRKARHAATGLMAIALYNWIGEEGEKTSGVAGGAGVVFDDDDDDD